MRLPVPFINKVEPRNGDNVRTIHFIDGGLRFNRAFNNAQKRYAREVHKAHRVYNIHEGLPYTSIIFTSSDETSSPHKDPLVVTLQVGSCNVCRILVDIKSLVNLFFLRIIMVLMVKYSDITKKELPLVRFKNSTTNSIGIVVKPVMVIRSIVIANFIVIDVLFHYNAILGRPMIHKIRVVLSTYHKVIKYQIEEGIREIRDDH